MSHLSGKIFNAMMKKHINLPADALQGRLILVTGATRGIGRAVALACAHAGAELIITGRTIGALEELDDDISAMGGKSTIVELDQTDKPAMPRLANVIEKRWGRLDGFVANAGQLGQMAPMAHIDPEGFERTLEVNLVSVWHQIAAFEPLLLAAPAGRAVLVSSGAAYGPRAFWGGYAVSKAGLEAMGRVWAAENEKNNLRINIINPGATATAMRKEAYPGEDATTLPSPEDIAPAFIQLLHDSCVSQGQSYTISDLITLSI